jgi:hypothetical protein
MLCDYGDLTWMRFDFFSCWLIAVCIAFTGLLFLWARWRRNDGLRKFTCHALGAVCAIEVLKLMPALFQILFAS